MFVIFQSKFLFKFHSVMDKRRVLTITKCDKINIKLDFECGMNKKREHKKMTNLFNNLAIVF